MSNIRLVFVGNLITLPWSPDHAGIIQALGELKKSKKIDDYYIADVNKMLSSFDLILNEIIEFHPTIIIHGMTDSLTQSWPEKIAARIYDVKQVMSMWDYRPVRMNYDNLWPTWRESGKHLNLITLSNKEQLGWWKEDFGVDTIYWPHGCVVRDTEFDMQYENEVVFTGDAHSFGAESKRTPLINEIDRILKEDGLSGVKWINEPGGDANSNRAIIWQNLGKIYHSAKTVLDISNFWDSEGYASGRYFYTAGLGGCSISKRFPGCEELFPEGTKAYFDTPEEAAFKIKYYINNEEERNNIKKNGKEWTNKYHTYNVRFKQLFKYLKIK